MKAAMLAATMALMVFIADTLRADEHAAREQMQVVSVLGKAELGLADAVGIALKQVPDGRPYEAKLLNRGDRPVWRVGLLGLDGFRQVLVDAADGKVLATQDDTAVLALWTFDGIESGKLPENWLIRENHPTKEMARWGVRPDPQAASPPNVLAVRTANDNATYNLAIAQKVSVQDFEMSVRVRPQTGGYDQGGGLIWRCQDPDNYYVCRINPLENNYRVYKVVNGKRQQLQSSEADTPAGRWHTLHVTMTGDHMTCDLNGRKMLDVRDDTFKAAGTVGLWTKADASSSFDDFVVIETAVKQKREKDAADEGHGNDHDKGDDR